MKSEMTKYILIGFLLGILVMFLFGADKNTETYRLYTDPGVAGVVHVFNTRTGDFETFASRLTIGLIGNDKIETFQHISAGKSISKQ